MIIYIFLYYILPHTKCVNFEFNNIGNNPYSITIYDNEIFTIDSIGVHIYKNQGTFVSSHSYTNHSSIMEISHMKNQNIIAFNGQDLFYFDKEGKYINQFDYPNFVFYGTGFYSISSYLDDQYLLIANISPKLYVTVMDNSASPVIERTFSISVLNYASCKKRILIDGVICGFIINDQNRSVGVLLLTTSFSIKRLLKVPTNFGLTLKLEKVSHYSFLLCYIDSNKAIVCGFFVDELETISNLFSIADNTENTSHTQLAMVSLSTKELLIAYAYNVGTGFIRLQKINYQGQLIGTAITITLPQVNSKITDLNIISFTITDRINVYGVSYGLIRGGLYFEEIDVSYCSDYCASVNLNTTFLFSLRIYSSSVYISIISNFNSGKLQQSNSDVVLNQEYLFSTVFAYIPEDVKTIVTGKFRAKNPMGIATSCLMTIIVGEIGKCKCLNPYFSFQNECVVTCPEYTYTDYDLQECINCATINKFFYKTRCLDEASLPSNVYVTNITFNVVEDCANTCATCINDKTHCLSCYSGIPCVLNCHEGYFHSLNLGKCEKCYDTCSKCSGEGDMNDNNCDACISGYHIFPGFPRQCMPTCNDETTSRWFIDDNNKFHCIKSTECPPERKIYTRDNNQCVESCSKESTCWYCRSLTQTLFNHTNTCVTKCPTGGIPDQKKNQCDPGPNIDIEITNKPVDDVLNDLNNNTTIVTKPNSTIIKGDDYIIEIVNTTDKGGNLQLSEIDFSKCEAILRKQYSIPKSDVLYIIKLDLDRDKEITSQVEYEVHDKNGVKLDLKYCENTTVDITYHIKNSTLLDPEKAKEFEKLGIDIYNPEDPFFTEICFPLTTENGTDIILSDRLKDIYQNVSLCEPSCVYKGVVLENMTVTCTCNVKPKVNTELNANFFIQGLDSAFTNSNFEVITCFHLVFDPSILVKNAAFWFYFILIGVHVPLWIIYFIHGLLSIQNYISKYPLQSPPKKGEFQDYIDKIIFKSQKKEIDDNNYEHQVQKSVQNKSNNDNEEDKISQYEKLTPNNKNSLFNRQINNEISSDRKSDQMDNENNIIITNGNSHNTFRTNSINEQQNDNEINGSKPKISKLESIISINTYNSNYLFNNEKNENNQSKELKEFVDIIPESTKLKKHFTKQSSSIGSHRDKEKLNDTKFFSKDKRHLIITTTIATDPHQLTINKLKTETEPIPKPKKKNPSMEILDDFDLISAKLYDTRSFWRLMYICLLSRHPVLFTFVKKPYFSLRTIIIIQYIFGNAMDFAFNALFFTDDLISERYNYEGNLGWLFSIQNNLLTSVASMIVSSVFGAFLGFLASSESKFEMLLQIKKEKQKYHERLRKVVICLKWKLIFFLILELLLMLFFWYYSMAFCAVYQNSQVSWVTGGLTSFALGLLIPIPICLAIILLRYWAIAKKYNCLFKLSIWCYKL